MSVELYVSCQKRFELPEVGCGRHAPHQCRDAGEFFIAAGGVDEFLRRVVNAGQTVYAARENRTVPFCHVDNHETGSRIGR